MTPKKQISQKQLDANRRNAQRCTGPKTPAGKIRSSQNATRHGLTGQVSVLPEEDREAFDQFSARLLQSLAPEGELELQLAHRIVTDNWRLNRASALEDNLFALGDAQYRRTIKARDPQTHAALTAARAFAEQGKQFQLLSLYEQRINRNLHKNMALLRDLQTERKAAREKQMKEAQALLQISAINGLTYEPAKDGFLRKYKRATVESETYRDALARTRAPSRIFITVDDPAAGHRCFVFSNAEIVAAIDRTHRLNEAMAMQHQPRLARAA